MAFSGKNHHGSRWNYFLFVVGRFWIWKSCISPSSILRSSRSPIFRRIWRTSTSSSSPTWTCRFGSLHGHSFTIRSLVHHYCYWHSTFKDELDSKFVGKYFLKISPSMFIARIRHFTADSLLTHSILRRICLILFFFWINKIPQSASKLIPQPLFIQLITADSRVNF